MMITLDLQSDTPIYTQLINQMMEGIAKAELLPGEELPSVRTLAADLGINLHTVRKAYQHLKQKEFIQIHRQKGVVVNPAGIPRADNVYMEHLRDSLRPVVAESICRSVSEDEFLAICREQFQTMQPKGRKK